MFDIQLILDSAYRLADSLDPEAVGHLNNFAWPELRNTLGDLLECTGNGEAADSLRHGTPTGDNSANQRHRGRQSVLLAGFHSSMDTIETVDSMEAGEGARCANVEKASEPAGMRPPRRPTAPKVVPHGADPVRSALERSYAAQLAVLQRIGITAPVVQDLGGGEYGLEGRAGFSPCGSRVLLTATNTSHTLTPFSHQSHVWFARLRDCDTMDFVGGGIAEALDVAVANAQSSMRSARGITLDTRTRETAESRVENREGIALTRCEAGAFTLERGKVTITLRRDLDDDWIANGRCDGLGVTSTFSGISLALDSVLAKLRVPGADEFRLGLTEGCTLLNMRNAS